MPVCRGVNAAELGKGEGLASRSTACPSERLPARKRAATNVREQNSNGLQNTNGLLPPHKNDAPLFR